MDPLVLHAAFVVIALALLATAMLLSPSAKRRCPSLRAGRHARGAVVPLRLRVQLTRRE
jgi:hypothetical protein